MHIDVLNDWKWLKNCDENTVLNDFQAFKNWFQAFGNLEFQDSNLNGIDYKYAGIW